MKTLTKILIISVIVFLVGAGLCIGGLAAIDFNWEVLTGEDKLVTAQQDFNAADYPGGVRGNFGSTDVEIGVSPDAGIHVIYVENGNYDYGFENEDGTLRINRSIRKLNLLLYNFIGFRSQEVKILLPEETAGSILISADSGRIALSGLTVGGDCKLTVSSGTVSVKDARLSSLSVSAQSGFCIVSDVHISGALQAETKSGNVNLTSCESASAELSVSSGRIRLNGLTVRSTVNATCGSGDIQLDGVEFGSLMYCKTASGSINGSVTGKREDYSIEVSTGSGDSNLVSGGNGAKAMELHTGSGNIRVTFEE